MNTPLPFGIFHKMVFAACLVLLIDHSSIAQTCTDNVPINTCIGTLNDGSGIASYSDNLDCSWTIINPLGSPIDITFIEFQTEVGNDVLSIFDGADENAPLLGAYSGANLPAPVQSSSDVVYITFTTNANTSGIGWQLNWNGTKLVSACNGSIDDGSGDDPYANGQYCAWRIAPAGATSITIHFEEFNIETKYDYLYIYDGPDTFSPMLGAFSGNFIPDPITTGPQMLVVFVTDGSGFATGWSADYTSVIPDFTECAGEFDQIENGRQYEANTECSYLISIENAFNIELFFTEFDLVDGQDYLYVHEGADINAPVINQLTGSEIPDVIHIDSDQLFLRFVSDDADQAGGFAFHYECNGMNVPDINSGTDLLIYPNPGNGKTKLKSTLNGQVEVFIFDHTGKVISRSLMNIPSSSEVDLDLQHLSSGLYTLQIHQDGIIQKTRLVIE